MILGVSYNRNIEAALYGPVLRRNISFFAATVVYSIFGYFFNALFSRLDFAIDRDVEWMRLASKFFDAWLSICFFIGSCFGAVKRLLQC